MEHGVGQSMTGYGVSLSYNYNPLTQLWRTATHIYMQIVRI